MTVRALVPAFAIALVAGGLALAFATIGSPEHNRLVAIDAARLDAIDAIVDAIDRDRAGAPAEPPELMPFQRTSAVADIAYKRINANEYRLCATFALPSDPDRLTNSTLEPPAGRSCYYYRPGQRMPLRRTNGI